MRCLSSYAVFIVILELNHHKDKVLGPAEREEVPVLRDRNRIGVRSAPLNLDEPQPAGAGDATFDVMAELCVLAIYRIVARPTLTLRPESSL